jgi:thiol-disulfide isomerase/thioredoxin
MNYPAYRILCLLCFFLIWLTAAAQGRLNQGDPIPHLPIKKILNAAQPSTSLAAFGDKLTVIDFFGTWCVPCLRALPHLADLKATFKEDVNILLVSNETEVQLKKFMAARNNFTFPVVVDEDNSWNNYFLPPSLPYTVVIRNGRIVAATDAASITKEAVAQWLKQNDTALPVNSQHGKDEIKLPAMTSNLKSKNNPVRLSQDFIYAAKTGDAVTALSQKLADMSYQALVNSLKTDNAKKAFWINLYNGYTQLALKANPEQYKSRNAFFRKKAIPVAGQSLSLDDIEHGILRRSKVKWSLGHLNKLFPSKQEKELRVEKLDWRIHFALNCGATSCPPIAFYSDETLDTQLKLAATAFLTGETEFDSIKNIVRLPKLMSWFRADFGGKKGIRNILRRYGIIPPNASPKIAFKDYDWTLALNNYSTKNP